MPKTRRKPNPSAPLPSIVGPVPHHPRADVKSKHRLRVKLGEALRVFTALGGRNRG